MHCAILKLCVCAAHTFITWNEFVVVVCRVHLSVSFIRFWDKYVCMKLLSISFHTLLFILYMCCYTFCWVDLRSINFNGIMHSQLFHVLFFFSLYGFGFYLLLMLLFFFHYLLYWIQQSRFHFRQIYNNNDQTRSSDFNRFLWFTACVANSWIFKSNQYL